MRQRADRYLLAAATIVAVVLLASSAALAGFSPLQQTSQPTTQESENVTFASARENESNPVIRHENPETLERTSANLDGAAIQLAESLGLRLTVSARELQDGNFTAAEGELGSAYQSDAIRLTEIAEATENASDDEIAAAYRNASAEQREAIRDAEEFRELYTTYQQARASQNETRARQAASQLAAKFDDINATAADLRKTYNNLEQVNKSKAKLAQEEINQTLQQARRVTQNARQSTYIQTNLTTTTIQRTASPTRPFTISGHLRTVNGTPLRNRTIVVGPAAHETTVQTNHTGGFTINHRPTILSSGQQSVTIRYRPNETSGYLGSMSTASVVVTQQEARIELQRVPDAMSNTSTGRFTGRVVVDDEGVPGVPVRLQLGEYELASGRTNASGAFDLTGKPPLTVPAGTIDAKLIAGAPDLAVASEQRAFEMAINETPTRLSLTVERIRPRTIRLTGDVRLQSGAPLTRQTVVISTANRTLGWFTTDTRGRFAGNLTLPTEQPGLTNAGPTLTITATVTDQSSHIQPASASDTVTLPAFAPDGVFGYGYPLSAWGLLIGAAGLLGGAVFLTRRRSRETDSADDPALSQDFSVQQPDLEESQADDTAIDSASLLASAQTTVSTDPQYAAQLGYTAVRAQLAQTLDVPSQQTLTHWEFFDRYDDQYESADEDHAQLQLLTDLYEQAVYTNQSVDEQTLERVLTYFSNEFADSN